VPECSPEDSASLRNPVPGHRSGLPTPESGVDRGELSPLSSLPHGHTAGSVPLRAGGLEIRSFARRGRASGRVEESSLRSAVRDFVATRRYEETGFGRPGLAATFAAEEDCKSEGARDVSPASECGQFV
jgi:hypothetical protein